MSIPNPPERGPDCPPAVALQAYSANSPGAQDLSAHLATCEKCATYVAELRQSQEAFVKMRPADQFLRKLDRREEEQKQRPRFAWLRFAVPIAAVLTVVMLLPLLGPHDAVTPKGESPFHVFSKRGEREARALGADDRVRAGDVLRFSYDAPTDGNLLVLDLDGKGSATVFYPYGAQRSAPILAGEKEAIPGSVALDETLGDEWLVAVFSDKPLEAAALLDQLRAQVGTNQIHLDCGNCRVNAVRVQKVK